ncbi:hypothetical protein CHS0354_015923 [Potamilus streckersoni]|uniref:Uncharacterized protein n=1 Tax=Potamilus streckersoni TaxID=2493646 RepID=A0AAE0SQR3_9BIVA|nr:hypothetical protein CHS0354_015923 [Potamilus streckersoni]
MASNNSDKILILQAVVYDPEKTEEMMVRISNGAYSPHSLKMEINNLKKVKEEVNNLILQEKAEKEGKELEEILIRHLKKEVPIKRLCIHL